MRSKKRRGVVIVAVLIVVASLSLAGYHYSDLMMAEQQASEYAHRSVQARALAASGIYYTAALLSDPDSFTNTLASNPWNNPDVFKAKPVQSDDKLKGYFSIIAPPDIDASSGVAVDPFYGVSDESGKINLNSMMKIDATGEKLHDMLIKLPVPNMSEEIVNAIIDWLDPDNDPRAGGAENDYYLSLSPPYRCKNGPIDSIDELLLVKGVTRDFLYGTDANRNGVQDGKEDGGGNGFSRGLAAYLTVHSREQNCAPDGTPYLPLNNSDLKKQYDAFLPIVGENMAKYIYLAARKGVVVGNPPLSNQVKLATLESYTPDFGSLISPYPIKSTFQLVGNSYVKSGNKVYLSPLKDYAQEKELLVKYLAVATLIDPATSPEIPSRVNVNTASRAVLTALKDVTSLTDSDIEKIMAARVNLDPTAELSKTPAWLLTEAGLSPKTLQNLDTIQCITTRTQVYRIQSVGYFEGKGPAMRVEAVVDTNNGRPRILAWRDLSELGKGWTDSTSNTPMP